MKKCSIIALSFWKSTQEQTFSGLEGRMERKSSCLKIIQSYRDIYCHSSPRGRLLKIFFMISVPHVGTVTVLDTTLVIIELISSTIGGRSLSYWEQGLSVQAWS